MTTSTVEEAFRRLAIGDPAFLAAVASHDPRAVSIQCLDPRTEALLRVAALVAVDASPSSYRSSVEAAQRARLRLLWPKAATASVGASPRDGLGAGPAAFRPQNPMAAGQEVLTAAGIVPSRLGSRGIGIHSLRKTAINDAIRNGATMHEVREFAGHADIRTTEVYFVRKEEDAEVAARRIQIRVTGRKGE